MRSGRGSARGSEAAEETVTVAVSLDGVMVAMKDAKRADGSAGYQEAGCGTRPTMPRGSGFWDSVLWPDAAAAQGGVEDDALLHWLGGDGGGVQDVGHSTAEAFGDVLASCRGPAPECGIAILALP